MKEVQSNIINATEEDFLILSNLSTANTSFFICWNRGTIVA